jgi:hypothetical protein
MRDVFGLKLTKSSLPLSVQCVYNAVLGDAVVCGEYQHSNHSVTGIGCGAGGGAARDCFTVNIINSSLSLPTIYLLNFRNLVDVYLGLSKVCVSVCMSETATPPTFLDGFG